MQDKMLKTPQVAEMLGVKKNTLEKARSNGKGNYPPHITIGRRSVFYRLSEVEAFIKRHSYNTDGSPAYR